ncbi:MAG: histidine-type phosphatase [Phascolarctobacterium sp.]|nr:histidine-type phosphatase [Phascolarctobacterium sp.]
MKKNIAMLSLSIFLFSLANGVQAASVLTEKGYALDKIFIFSRHNVRTRIGNADKVIAEYTARKWEAYPEISGHLTPHGSAAETLMGAYYRQYLEDEGFIPKDWHPDEDEIRFYANSYQRTIATARSFACGLTPVTDVKIEYYFDIDKKDPVFHPSTEIKDEEQFKKAAAWYDEMEEGHGQKAFFTKVGKNLRSLEKIVAFKNSPFARDHKRKTIDEGQFAIIPNKGKIAGNKESFNSFLIADAFIVRYYHTADDKKATWNTANSQVLMLGAGKYLTSCTDILLDNPAYSKNFIRNLVPEITKELKNDAHKFSFFCGHDTNVGALTSVLNVVPFELPATITPHTPIGGKLVVEKRKGIDNKYYASLNMVYASDKELRNLETLSLKNPPMKYPLVIKNLKSNDDGLYDWDEFVAHFENSVKP